MNPLNRQLKPIPRKPERILQFGEGNFLRAFVDWMVHEMNQKTEFNAGVVVVQPIERGMVDTLNAQDGLYTVHMHGLKAGAPHSEKVLVDCITRGLNPYADFAAFMASAEIPTIDFVISNTTEAGITFREEDRAEDEPPATFPAKLTVWLYHRWQHFEGNPTKGVHLIPCELIAQNGEALRTAIKQYAKHWQLEPEFSQWLIEHSTFTDTLVDRIVTGYPKAQADLLCEELGYEDRLLAEGELFHLWVMEAPLSLVNVFPAKEAGLNVIFTNDLEMYRTQKVRILNGAHTAMVPVGLLSGLQTVKETVLHPSLGVWLSKLIFEEIVPTIQVPAVTLEKFANDVLDRFRNPFMEHQLSSIALNAMAKYETRILPTVLDYWELKGQWPERLVFALAVLIAQYRGSFAGEPTVINDHPDVVDFMAKCWEKQGENQTDFSGIAAEVLAYKPIWKSDLNRLPGLAAKLADHLRAIHAEGLAAAVAQLAKA